VTSNHDNIIPLPSSLNNARGNRKYTNRIDGGYLAYACKSCPTAGFCSGAMVITEEGVVPPDVFKGPIARSVLRSVDKYPQFAKDIDRLVLDLETATEWNRRFPIRLEEAGYRSNCS
jgi:endonuclease I